MIFRNIVTGTLHWDFVGFVCDSNMVKSLKQMVVFISLPLEDSLAFPYSTFSELCFTLFQFIFQSPLYDRATGGIKINLTEVLQLGQEWSSQPLIEFANSLLNNSTNANAGNLVGNRMFYANDYMARNDTISVYTYRT